MVKERTSLGMQQPLSDLLRVPRQLGPVTGPYAWYWNGIPMEYLLVPAMAIGIGLLRIVLQYFVYAVRLHESVCASLTCVATGTAGTDLPSP